MKNRALKLLAAVGLVSLATDAAAGDLRVLNTLPGLKSPSVKCDPRIATMYGGCPDPRFVKGADLVVFDEPIKRYDAFAKLMNTYGGDVPWPDASKRKPWEVDLSWMLPAEQIANLPGLFPPPINGVGWTCRYTTPSHLRMRQTRAV